MSGAVSPSAANRAGPGAEDGPRPAGTRSSHTGRGAPPWLPVLGSTVFLVAAVVAQMLRQSGTEMWRTVWAEDGTEFLNDALADPLRENLFETYAGYGHVIPRILASIGSNLPQEHYAKWAALSSAAIVALCALFVYWASAPLLRAPLRQAILAVAILLHPVLPLEILGAICNIHWSLPIACLFAVVLPVERPWAIAVRIPLAVLGPLSSPLCLVFAPVVVVQLVLAARRWRAAGGDPPEDGPRRRLVVPVLYLLAVAGQLAMYAVAEKMPTPDTPVGERIDGIIRLYPTRVITNLVLGVRTSEALWEQLGWLVAIVTTAAVAAVLVLKARRSDRVARWWIVALVASSMAIYAYSIWSRSEIIEAMIPGTRTYAILGARYEVFPSLLVLVALLLPTRLSRGVLTSSRPRPPVPVTDGPAPPPATEVSPAPAGGLVDRVSGGQPWRVVTVAAVAWLAIGLLPSYRLDNGRSEGPVWTDRYYEAANACRDNPDWDWVPVPISPEAPQWFVRYDCDRIES